jgi:hypothetical protein
MKTLSVSGYSDYYRDWTYLCYWPAEKQGLGQGQLVDSNHRPLGQCSDGKKAVGGGAPQKSLILRLVRSHLWPNFLAQWLEHWCAAIGAQVGSLATSHRTLSWMLSSNLKTLLGLAPICSRYQFYNKNLCYRLKEMKMLSCNQIFRERIPLKVKKM